MANYTYLSVIKDNVSHYLFEGKDTLPFFWICLLDQNIVNNKSLLWKEAMAEEEEEDFDQDEQSDKCILILTKDVYITNADRSRTFLEQHFPTTLPLYDDFLNCINKHINDNGVVAIELIEHIWFYNTVQEFTDSLLNEVQAIENNTSIDIRYLSLTDLTNMGTGFPSIDNQMFNTLDNYKLAEEIRVNPKHQDSPYKPGDIKSDFIWLLVCVLFSGIIYWMYIADVPRVAIIIVALFNLLFYYISLRMLTDDIKNKRKQQHI